MRVLVTGAAGFVGTWLVRELRAAGHQVVGSGVEAAPPGESAGDWVPLDVTDAGSIQAAMAAARPQAVVHLAAQASVGASFADALGTWDVNATGTLRLLESLPEATRLLFVSSAECYGVVPEPEQPIREERPLRPTNPYAASKAAAEMAVLAAAEQGRHAVVARAFNHTGPGQDARFALPGFARQLAEIRLGRAQPLLRVGTLSARRDLLDVRDVVRAYVRLLEAGEPGGVYNVCSGTARTMQSAVEELMALSGLDVRVEVDPQRVRPVDLPLLLGDGTRLRALGWEPRVPFAQTLRDLLDAQLAQLQSPAGVAA